jgi:hypothetical protein
MYCLEPFQLLVHVFYTLHVIRRLDMVVISNIVLTVTQVGFILTTGMSRIPPSLLYLTIYNPTLRPDIPEPDDDEDAEEQAQILFYTSRDRAASRDKMLRQVGLAKALVNFAE